MGIVKKRKSFRFRLYLRESTITGGIRPLLEDNTARPLRYSPGSGEFVVGNGGEFFNRPIYGPISSFRVDAGDRPEFSLYLPGHGGNLKLGFATADGEKWAANGDEVVARYRPGRMIYEIRDRLLRGGSLSLELLTAAQGSGLLLRVRGRNVPAGTLVTWGFGGVSGRKGRRNGDIGCEVEPVSQFFQVRPDECAGNSYSIETAAALGGTQRPASRLHSDFCELLLTFPPGSQLRVQDFSAWETPPTPKGGLADAPPKLPILTGLSEIGEGPLHFTIQRVDSGEAIRSSDPASDFDARSREMEQIANTISFDTPDPYLNAAAPALGVVADALWDPIQPCVMHGCVAWRLALAGWRGPMFSMRREAIIAPRPSFGIG